MGIALLHPSYKFETVLTVGWVEASFADTIVPVNPKPFTTPSPTPVIFSSL
jgi:hypothetical protein